MTLSYEKSHFNTETATRNRKSFPENSVEKMEKKPITKKMLIKKKIINYKKYRIL